MSQLVLVEHKLLQPHSDRISLRLIHSLLLVFLTFPLILVPRITIRLQAQTKMRNVQKQLLEVSFFVLISLFHCRLSQT